MRIEPNFANTNVAFVPEPLPVPAPRPMPFAHHPIMPEGTYYRATPIMPLGVERPPVMYGPPPPPPAPFMMGPNPVGPHCQQTPDGGTITWVPVVTPPPPMNRGCATSPDRYMMPPPGQPAPFFLAPNAPSSAPPSPMMFHKAQPPSAPAAPPITTVKQQPSPPAKGKAVLAAPPARQPYRDVPSEEDVSRNLYITGLSPEVTDDVLLTAFSAHAKVLSFKVMIDLDTGLNRGYAFVMLETVEAAHRACAAMDGVLLGSRHISVRMAEMKKHHTALPGLPTKKVFMRNLPLDVTDEMIKAALPEGTHVVEIAINPDINSGLQHNMAHVVCETVEQAQRVAARLNGTRPFPSSVRPLLTKVVDTLARARKAAHVAAVRRGEVVRKPVPGISGKARPDCVIAPPRGLRSESDASHTQGELLSPYSSSSSNSGDAPQHPPQADFQSWLNRLSQSADLCGSGSD